MTGTSPGETCAGGHEAVQETATLAWKKAAKTAFVAGDGRETTTWVPIPGMWLAYAVDGKGYHNGDGKYTVTIPVEDFGAHFHLGGHTRLMINGGDHKRLYHLPDKRPPPGTGVTFVLDVCPRAANGRTTTVAKLETRMCARA